MSETAPFTFDVNAYTGGFRGFLVAASGRGKSHLAGLICEQAIAAGMPLVIVDPEGEYYTLSERFPLIVVGGPHANVPLGSGEAISKILEAVLEARCSVVFDLSDLVQAEQRDAWGHIGESLFMLKKTGDRSTVLVVVEEAQEFAPQIRVPGMSNAAETIVRRGRKRGIWSLWVTQRSADISKALISQCNVLMAGGLEIEHDFEAIKRRVTLGFEDLRALERGLFYVSPPGAVMRVPARTVTHAGATPELGLSQSKRAEVQAIADRLAALIAAPDKPDSTVNNGADIARASRAETELRTVRGQLERSDAAKMLAERDWKAAVERVKALEGQSEDALAFVTATRKLLGAAPAVDIDAIVAKVMVRLGNVAARPTVAEVPIAALRTQFMQVEVTRLVAGIRELPAESATLLMWLVQYEKHIGIGELLARAIGYRGKGGSTYVRASGNLSKLSALGLVENAERQGWRATVREKIAGDLSAYSATDQDREDVYQTVIAEIMSVQRNGSAAAPQ